MLYSNGVVTRPSTTEIPIQCYTDHLECFPLDKLNCSIFLFIPPYTASTVIFNNYSGPFQNEYNSQPYDSENLEAQAKGKGNCLNLEWDMHQNTFQISTRTLTDAFRLNYSGIAVEFQLDRLPYFQFYVTILPMVLMTLISLSVSKITRLRHIPGASLLITASLMITFFGTYFSKGGEPTRLTTIFILTYIISGINSVLVLRFQKSINTVRQKSINTIDTLGEKKC